MTAGDVINRLRAHSDELRRTDQAPSSAPIGGVIQAVRRAHDDEETAVAVVDALVLLHRVAEEATRNALGRPTGQHDAELLAVLRDTGYLP